MDNYNYYLEGYNNSICFTEVPDFETSENVKAYALGSVDGKCGMQKTEDEFDAAIK